MPLRCAACSNYSCLPSDPGRLVSCAAQLNSLLIFDLGNGCRPDGTLVSRVLTRVFLASFKSNHDATPSRSGIKLFRFISFPPLNGIRLLLADYADEIAFFFFFLPSL